MKTSGRGACLGVCAAIASLAFSGIASAKPGYEVQPKSLGLSLKLPDSNGYSMSILTVGHKQVYLTASKGHVHTSYEVTGRVTRHRVDADFGDLGHISVQFQGSPRTPEQRGRRRQGCRGRPPIREAGTFRGTISFEGERDFADVLTHRAKGHVSRSFKRICKRRKFAFAPVGKGQARTSGSSNGFSLSILTAESRSAGRTTSFGAIGLDLGPGTPKHAPETISLIFAGFEEVVDRVHIAKSAFDVGDPGAVLLSKPGVHPESATVTLSKPFEGAASYLESPGSPPSWTGELSVRLPGAGTVPLTGPGFGAAICRVHSPKGLEKCDLPGRSGASPKPKS
jgi:hypothetical protein